MSVSSPALSKIEVRGPAERRYCAIGIATSTVSVSMFEMVVSTPNCVPGPT